MNEQMVSMSFAGSELSFRTGRLANMASGACEVRFNNSLVLVTGTMGGCREGADFFPLSVDFQERFYAAGKIKGSKFIKRDGRPTETAILTSRLIDRPIRPLFPKGFTHEVQILATVLSADDDRDTGILALNGASMALMLSGMPFEGPVGAVRVGYNDGNYILHPTYDEITAGQLDLVVAGGKDAITMVEAGIKELPEDIVLGALEFAHAEIKKICELQEQLVAKCNVTPLEYSVPDVTEDLVREVSAAFTDSMIDDFYGLGKLEFYAKLKEYKEQIKEQYAEKFESDEWTSSEFEGVMKSRLKERMRQRVLEEDLRLDKRKLDEVRTVTCDAGILPRTHGSGLFKRGDTQILTVTTLGGPQDAQVVDEMSKEEKRRYMHHYNFPPYSVGEVRPMRGVSRREIGHGFLAERALVPVLPKEEDFAYTMLLVSETLACNGSSSMGSVCGSTLSLMDAGVPITAPVVGIAMGLISDEEKGVYKILSDIQAQEDFLGDMDFKVTGTDKGLTALQMDIKLSGLKIDLLRDAMKQAKAGRDFIWEGMAKALDKPRAELSPNAPMLTSFSVDPDTIRLIIGKGGETINKLIDTYNVQIDINDDGIVTVTAQEQESGNAAVEHIKKIAYIPQVGDIAEGKVVRVLEFGALVEIAPERVGMVHISELAHERVAKVEDVLKEGDTVRVKVMSYDQANGKIGLSRKALLDKNS